MAFIGLQGFGRTAATGAGGPPCVGEVDVRSSRRDGGFAGRVWVGMLAMLLACGSAVRADAWRTSPVALQGPGDSANGASANADTAPVFLNATDGRYLAFASRATNLVAGQVDDNGTHDVFLLDRTTGTTMLVSRRLGAATETQAGTSVPYGISDDGRYVLYSSNASDVLAGVTDANAAEDLFLFDRVAGTTRLVTHLYDSTVTTSTGFIQSAVLSGDGRYAAYVTNANGLVQATTGPQTNVFLWDRDSGVNTLVSHAAGSFDQVSLSAEAPRISADGRYVAWQTIGNNAVAVDSNGSWDVFLYDRATGANTIVSRQAGTTTTPANNSSYTRAITPNGRYVLFISLATNVVAGQVDSQPRFDVFVFDAATGGMSLVSHAVGAATTVGNADSIPFGISADGSRVLFHSHASNLGATDPNGTYADTYAWDRATNVNTLVSRRRGTTTTTCELGGYPVAYSADGEHAVFLSEGTDLVDAVSDVNVATDVFTFARSTGVVRLVSRSTAGSSTAGGESGAGAIAGGVLAFWSEAPDLAAAVVDANGASDAFVFDLAAATTTLATRGVAGAAPATLGAGSSNPFASPDGRFILFASASGGVVDGTTDPNGASDVFLRDRVGGATWLVSRSAAGATAAANAAATPAAVTPDGRWALYSSLASNVVAGVSDTNGVADAFLFDRETATTTLVSRSGVTAGATGNGLATPRALSADGRYVLYTSRATDVIAGLTDSNTASDVFLFDRVSGTTTLAGRSNTANQTPAGSSTALAISQDGRWTLFRSEAGNVAGSTFDVNNFFGFGAVMTDLFLFDRDTSSTLLVSHAFDNATATGSDGVVPGPMTPDARYVLFSSRAILATGMTDNNNVDDVYLYDRTTNASTLVSRVGSSSATPNGASLARALSDDGRWVLYSSAANNIVAVADSNGAQHDLYLFDRDTPGAVLVNPSVSAAGSTANFGANQAALSSDGRWVAFGSFATDLVAGSNDTTVREDVFVHDRVAARTTLLSRAHGSSSVANNFTTRPAFAAGARDVVVESLASDLSPDTDDPNGALDVYVAEHRFTVTVSAAGSGTVSPGTTEVAFGATASFDVTAAPHYGVNAVTGCGGALAGSTYTTGAVDGDCTVSATFGNSAPSIGAIGDLVVLEDSAARVMLVDVEDVESAEDTLALGATSSETARIAHPGVTAAAGPAQRTLTFQPVANANGAATITLTLVDVPGASSNEAFVVTITPVNDAPTLAFAAAPRHPQGTSGAQSRPAFALVDVGPADEDAVQGIDGFTIVSVADPSGVVSPGSVGIANYGTLSYALTGASGTAVVQANVRDDAGSQNGGQSLSATQSFSIVVEGLVLFADGFE